MLTFCSVRLCAAVFAENVKENIIVLLFCSKGNMQHAAPTGLRCRPSAKATTALDRVCQAFRISITLFASLSESTAA